jgi:hypothetical protein
MNERDTLRNKLYYDKSSQDSDRKDIESKLYQAKDEFVREQKTSRERVTKLETVSFC